MKPEDSFVTFKNKPIENVSEHKFLGTVLKSNGNLNLSLAELANKARQVIFLIKSKTVSMGNLPVKVSCNLFDKLVVPILLYNSEILFMDCYKSYHNAKVRAKQKDQT